MRKNLPYVWIGLFIILCISKDPMLIIYIGTVLVSTYLLSTHLQQRDFARLITTAASTALILYHHATNATPPYAMMIAGGMAIIYAILTLVKEVQNQISPGD